MPTKKQTELTIPMVSAEELRQAWELLSKNDEMKRARSNMAYWLKQRKLDGEYNSKSAAAKEEYLEH